MRRCLIPVLALFAALATPAQAQIGKRIAVQAGSPEDKALSEISATSDPARKLELIDKFFAEYGKGDMAIVGYELYIAYYQAAKNYDKVSEYAEKLLSVDAENFPAAVNLFRAAQEKGDTQKLFAAGERVGALLAQYKAKPAPEGTTAEGWQLQKSSALAEAQDNINYVEYTLFSIGYQTRDPLARAALLERFAAAFPDSPYTANAQTLIASAYQEAQNYPKMLNYGQKILAGDPKNLSMLLLLSDYFSERGEQLDKAEGYAKKALDLLATAKKPEVAGLTEDQWAKQVALQKGLAWTSLGQIYINRRRDAQAVEAFRTAAPLLKADQVTYARNQYRMGFALLNLKRVAEARAALTETASINSPYRPLAQEKLKTLAAAPAKKRP
jgi:tetratricopeptide (TPR) repeat protein